MLHSSGPGSSCTVVCGVCVCVCVCVFGCLCMASSPYNCLPHICACRCSRASVRAVERGSSVGRMPDSQSRDPGFESPLLPFRSLGIFFHFTTPQSTQLYT